MLNFKIENLGPVAKAELELEGLTVLVGENGSGKTNLMNMCWDVLDTFISADYVKEKYFIHHCDALSTEIHSHLSTAFRPYRDLIGRSRSYSLSYFDFLQDPNIIKSDFIQSFQINDLFPLRRERIRSLIIDKESLNEQILQIVADKFDNYFSNIPKSDEEFAHEAYSFTFSNRYGIYPTKESTAVLFKDIEIFDRNQKFADVLLNRNVVAVPSVNVSNALFNSMNSIIEEQLSIASYPSGYTDNQLNRSILKSNSIFGNRYSKKLKEYNTSNLDKELLSLVSDLEEDFGFSTEVRKEGFGGYNLFLNTKQGSFEHKKVASGYQMMALLQHLLKTGDINRDTILFIDEPEASLHPEWQLKLSIMLCKLVELGVCVTVATHSPLMVETIHQIAVNRKQLKDITRIYLAEQSKNGYVFKNRTKQVDKVTEALIDPLTRVVFLS